MVAGAPGCKIKTILIFLSTYHASVGRLRRSQDASASHKTKPKGKHQKEIHSVRYLTEISFKIRDKRTDLREIFAFTFSPKISSIDYRRTLRSLSRERLSRNWARGRWFLYFGLPMVIIRYSRTFVLLGIPLFLAGVTWAGFSCTDEEIRPWWMTPFYASSQSGKNRDNEMLFLNFTASFQLSFSSFLTFSTTFFISICLFFFF